MVDQKFSPWTSGAAVLSAKEHRRCWLIEMGQSCEYAGKGLNMSQMLVFLVLQVIIPRMLQHCVPLLPRHLLF